MEVQLDFPRKEFALLDTINLTGVMDLPKVPINTLSMASQKDKMEVQLHFPRKVFYNRKVFVPLCTINLHDVMDLPKVPINTLSMAIQKDKMEVQLDFPRKEFALFDTINLLGVMEKVLGYKLTKSIFVAIRKLEVMYIWKFKHSEIPKNLSFPDLRMLFLHSGVGLDLIDIPFSFFELMPALKYLDMSNTSINLLPPSVTKLIKLNSLILRSCDLLRELPREIASLVNLEKLDLRDCKSLKKLPESIDSLKCLEYLYISGCTSLNDIPECINFPGRRILDLSNCKSLTKLPESITRLSFLRHIFLSGCTNLAKLPESIQGLCNLTTVDLTDCKSLTKLPESIRELSILKEIKMSGCSNLFDVPTGLNAVKVSINRLLSYIRDDKMEVQLDFSEGEGTLLDIKELLCLIENILKHKFWKSELVAAKKLKVIYIRNSKLSEIPDNISFPDLEMLFLDTNLDLAYIPSSFFEKMLSLRVLDMSNTSIKTLPPSVFKLIKMEELFLRHCEHLMELPREIRALVNLKVMDLEGTDLASLPEELGELINLKCLKVSLYDAESYRNCNKIVAIIPEKALSKLTQLDELSINVDPQDIWCNAAVGVIIKELPSLRNLKSLKIYLPNTVLLQDLLELKWNNNDLSFYQNLANFNFVIGPSTQHFITRLPPDLEQEFLKLKKCLKFVNGEGNIDKFAKALKHANALYIDRHWTIQTLSVFKLEELKGLKYCLLVDCNRMHTVFDESDIDHGVADTADSFLSLQYLGMHYLKELEVIWKGPGVGCCLRSLKVLTIHMCPNLNTIFTKVSLGYLVNLKEIIVEDCPKIKTLIAEDEFQFASEKILPELKKLSLFYLPELVSISSTGLSIAPKLESLIIYDCPNLKMLPSMGWWNEDNIIIKGESEWWDALEWNEPAEGRSDQPNYQGHVFSILDTDEAFLDELAPGYGNSLHSLVHTD